MMKQYDTEKLLDEVAKCGKKVSVGDSAKIFLYSLDNLEEIGFFKDLSKEVKDKILTQISLTFFIGLLTRTHDKKEMEALLKRTEKEFN